MKILQNHEHLLIFEIKNYHISFINALRRVMMSEIKIPAIESIDIIHNTGLMKREELTLRMGLIPLNMNSDGVLHLDVTATDRIVEVMSGDLKGETPPRPDVLITKLGPGQRLKLTAFIQQDVGKTNAKYSPVCSCFYRFVPRIRLKRRIYGKDAETLVELLPNVFGIKNKELVVVDERNYYFDIDIPTRFNDCVDVQYNDTHVIFTVETTGEMKAKDLFLRALEVLRDKLDEMLTMI